MFQGTPENGHARHQGMVCHTQVIQYKAILQSCRQASSVKNPWSSYFLLACVPPPGDTPGYLTKRTNTSTCLPNHEQCSSPALRKREPDPLRKSLAVPRVAGHAIGPHPPCHRSQPCVNCKNARSDMPPLIANIHIKARFVVVPFESST